MRCCASLATQAQESFIVEARHAGGALARRPEDAMPFGFRSPWFISALAAAPTPQALEVGRQSVAALLEALKPALTGEVLLNSHARNEPRAHRTFEPTVATRALEQLDTRLQSQFRRIHPIIVLIQGEWRGKGTIDHKEPAYEALRSAPLPMELVCFCEERARVVRERL